MDVAITPEFSALVEAQDGVAARKQALASGLSRHAIDHRLASGRWRPVLPGVFATHVGPLPERARLQAALLHGGATAQLTADTACRLLGVRYLPADDGIIRILIDHRTRVRSLGFVDVTRSLRLPTPVRRGGLPITPAARACIDTARRLHLLRDVRGILADAVQRGLVSVEALVTELEESHSAGSLLPRRAVDDLIAGTRSAPEAELRELVLTSDVLPEPEWNARIVDNRGYLIAIADALWREARMSAEVNSLEHHFFRDTWEATMQRQARVAAAGIVVVPLSPHRLRRAPDAVLRELESTYLAQMTRSAS